MKEYEFKQAKFNLLESGNYKPLADGTPLPILQRSVIPLKWNSKFLPNMFSFPMRNYRQENEKENRELTEKNKRFENDKKTFLNDNPDFNMFDIENELKPLISDIKDIGTTKNKIRMLKTCALIDTLLKVKLSVSRKYLGDLMTNKGNLTNVEFSKKKSKKLDGIKKHFSVGKVQEMTYTPTAKFNKNVLTVEGISGFKLLDTDDNATFKDKLSSKTFLIQSPLYSREYVTKVIDGKKRTFTRKVLADKTLNIHNLNATSQTTFRSVPFIERA